MTNLAPFELYTHVLVDVGGGGRVVATGVNLSKLLGQGDEGVDQECKKRSFFMMKSWFWFFFRVLVFMAFVVSIIWFKVFSISDYRNHEKWHEKALQLSLVQLRFPKIKNN